MTQDALGRRHAGSVLQSSAERPLFDVLPALRARVHFCPLGEYPSPVVALPNLAASSSLPRSLMDSIWIKRDDISSPIYGGNKVRTLETLFGHAQRSGCDSIAATGAYGSNHAVATVLHAPRVGLAARALLFPQPLSATAQDNLRVTAARASGVTWLPHWAWLPWAMRQERARAQKLGRREFVMPPGGAMPLGALGYVSAALELALQVQRQELPAPRVVLLAVGSTCTSAGLLLGLRLARRFGLVPASGQFDPQVVSVRVTPWPVTSRLRIVGLARRTAELIYCCTGEKRCDVPGAELSAGLQIDGSFLGRGYGRPTEAGRAAMALLGDWGERALDTTYASKSAAALLHHAVRSSEGGPLLYWATKSSVALPMVETPPQLPRRVAAFLGASW